MTRSGRAKAGPPGGAGRHPILYIDMDNVLVDFRSGLARVSEAELERHGDPDDIPGIFARMDPMPEAVDSFHQLFPRFDTFVLSTAPWDNPSAWSDKVQWIKQHLGERARKRLILTHNKHLNAGDFLVDDRTSNGADRFPGEHILFGSEDFPDWRAVRAYLLRKAESMS